ncbi:head-tail connector protein [Bradyrhizobium liaoningense]
MTIIVITPPTVEALTLVDCKAALGISGTSQDPVIGAAIGAATDALDASTRGWLGRAIRVQQLELQLDSFAAGWECRNGSYSCHREAIELPYPPLITVASVKYFDSAGIDRTLVEGTDYRVQRMKAIDGKQLVEPVYGGSWPAARREAGSVRIRYNCGYDGSTNVMPRQLKTAIMLGVRALMTAAARDPMLLEDRVEGIGSKRYQSDSKAAQVVIDAADALLSGLRIW